MSAALEEALVAAAPIEELPAEVLAEIFARLDVAERLGAVYRACSVFRGVVTGMPNEAISIGEAWAYEAPDEQRPRAQETWRFRRWPSDLFVRDWSDARRWSGLSVRQRERLLCLAASSGCVSSLRLALREAGVTPGPAVLSSAAVAGAEGCVSLLLEAGCGMQCSAAEAAASGGHTQTLRLLLHAVRFPGSSAEEDCMRAAMRGAASGGHWALLSQLLQGIDVESPDEETEDFRVGLATLAAERGREETALACLNGFAYWDAALPARLLLLEAAARGSSLAFLQTVLRRCGDIPAVQSEADASSSESDEDDMEVSAGLARRLQLRADVLVAAAGSWTRDWRAKLAEVARWSDLGAVRAAVWLGRRLRLWPAGRPVPDVRERIMALRGLQLEVPVPEAARAVLAWGVPLALVEYAAAGGMTASAVFGSFRSWAGVLPYHCLRQLQALVGAGLSLSGSDASRAAAWAAPECLEWLERHLDSTARPAIGWSGVFSAAARAGASLEMLRRLVDQRGAAIDVVAVCGGGSLAAVQWAVEQCLEAQVAIDWTAASNAALERGNVHALRHLHVTQGAFDGVSARRAFNIGLLPVVIKQCPLDLHSGDFGRLLAWGDAEVRATVAAADCGPGDYVGTLEARAWAEAVGTLAQLRAEQVGGVVGNAWWPAMGNMEVLPHQFAAVMRRYMAYQGQWGFEGALGTP